MEHKRIQQRTFDKKFTLVSNPRDGSHQFDWTYMVDVAFYSNAEREKRLWTVVDCDGKLYIMAGWHFVNRMYYVVTNEPYDKLYQCRW
jgi:hypothetical protein